MARIVPVILHWVSLLSGCSTLTTDHEPVLHGPFSETIWRSDKRAEEIPSEASDKGEIRRLMVDAALALLEKGETSSDYGATDVLKALRAAYDDTDPRLLDGLDGLLSLAKKKGAYRTDGVAYPGDIVLFHNQRDINGNGENDDWLTGAGIVVKSLHSRFEAVTRTGNAPRRVAVWPNRPSLRLYEGETANSFVRIPQREDPPDTAYLAGQLYAGHVDIEALAGE